MGRGTSEAGGGAAEGGRPRHFPSTTLRVVPLPKQAWGGIGGVRSLPTSAIGICPRNLGLFDIIFPDFTVSLYGEDFITGGFPAPGFYTLEASIDQGPTFGFGGLALSFTVPLVPEPASWALMAGGFGVLGGALRKSRKKTNVTFAA